MLPGSKQQTGTVQRLAARNALKELVETKIEHNVTESVFALDLQKAWLQMMLMLPHFI